MQLLLWAKGKLGAWEGFSGNSWRCDAEAMCTGWHMSLGITQTHTAGLKPGTVLCPVSQELLRDSKAAPPHPPSHFLLAVQNHLMSPCPLKQTENHQKSGSAYERVMTVWDLMSDPILPETKRLNCLTYSLMSSVFRFDLWWVMQNQLLFFYKHLKRISPDSTTTSHTVWQQITQPHPLYRESSAMGWDHFPGDCTIWFSVKNFSRVFMTSLSTSLKLSID